MKAYEKLRDARLHIGITQEYIAKELGIPRTAVVQIENGKRKITADELASLCNIYGVSADFILSRESVCSPFRMVAESFDSLPESDRREIASLIKFKCEMVRRRKQNC